MSVNVRDRLQLQITQLLGNRPGSAPLPVDVRLADLGLSSVQMVNLMLLVEAEFGIDFPQEDITPENFATITAIESLVERHHSLAGRT